MKRLLGSASTLCMIATSYFLLADSNPNPSECSGPDVHETQTFAADGCGYHDVWKITHTSIACTQEAHVVPRDGYAPNIFSNFRGNLDKGWSSTSEDGDRTCTTQSLRDGLGFTLHCVGPGSASCDIRLPLWFDGVDAGDVDAASPDASDAGDAAIDAIDAPDGQ